MLRRLYRQFRQISPYYYGDFYPLTPWTRDNKAWMAWQFDRPEVEDGMIQAFRRPEAADETLHFQLGGLDPAAQYQVANLDGDTSVVIAGRELLKDGFPVTIAERPGVAIFVYEKTRP